MSDNDKNRIKIKLPAVSYDIVKLAATLTGTSVKSFAAQAGDQRSPARHG